MENATNANRGAYAQRMQSTQGMQNMHDAIGAQGKNLPEMRFKAGGITATVWSNKGLGKDGQETSYNTISIERKYKDKDGNWQSTGSLRVNDLPKAALAITKAYEYIVLNDASLAA